MTPDPRPPTAAELEAERRAWHVPRFAQPRRPHLASAPIGDVGEADTPETQARRRHILHEATEPRKEDPMRARLAFHGGGD